MLASVSMLDYPLGRLSVTVVAVPTDKEAAVYVKEADDEKLKINLLTIEASNVDVQRNYGLKQCKNEYVLVVDDDVILNRSVLKKGLQTLLTEHKIAAVGYPLASGSRLLGEELHHGRIQGILTTTPTVMPCSLFRKSALLKTGFYREDMGPPVSIHEDWELGSRIRKCGFILMLDGTLVNKHSQVIRKPVSSTLGAEPQKILSRRQSAFYLKTKVSRGLSALKSYINSYLNGHYKTFFWVMNSSSLSQRLEYTLYFVLPLIGVCLGFVNLLYLLIYVLSIVVAIDLHSLIKRYYSAFSFKKRLAYPLLIVAIRVFRTYLSLLGLAKSKLAVASKY